MEIFASAKTSAAIISKINTEIVRILTPPDVKNFFNAGSKTVGSAPAQLLDAIKTDMTRKGVDTPGASIKLQ